MTDRDDFVAKFNKGSYDIDEAVQYLVSLKLDPAEEQDIYDETFIWHLLARALAGFGQQDFDMLNALLPPSLTAKPEFQELEKLDTKLHTAQFDLFWKSWEETKSKLSLNVPNFEEIMQKAILKTLSNCVLSLTVSTACEYLNCEPDKLGVLVATCGANVQGADVKFASTSTNDIVVRNEDKITIESLGPLIE